MSEKFIVQDTRTGNIYVRDASNIVDDYHIKVRELHYGESAKSVGDHDGSYLDQVLSDDLNCSECNLLTSDKTDVKINNDNIDDNIDDIEGDI